MIIKKTIYFSLFILVACVLFSCKKDQQSSVQPVLPPFESIVLLDLNSFGVTKKGTATFDHVNAAKAILNVWNKILNTDFALPLAAFKQAATVQSVKTGDNQWSWTYTIDNKGVPAQVVLTGSYNAATVQWTMLIDNVKWLDGSSNVNQGIGNWNFFKNKTTPYMNINWWFVPSDKTGKITYTNVNTLDTERTSYLRVILSTANDYDVVFDSFQKSTNTSADIEWNTKNNVGGIQSNGSGWLYWDNNYTDI